MGLEPAVVDHASVETPDSCNYGRAKDTVAECRSSAA